MAYTRYCPGVGQVPFTQPCPAATVLAIPYGSPPPPIPAGNYAPAPRPGVNPNTPQTGTPCGGGGPTMTGTGGSTFGAGGGATPATQPAATNLLQLSAFDKNPWLIFLIVAAIGYAAGRNVK